MSSETSRCRERLRHFCSGYGIDVGYGGDTIIPSAITVDLPTPYTKVGDTPLNLGGDAKDLYWFKDNVLDYVYSSHLLEDFEDTQSVLKEWLRVIKPGGYLVLFCPDEQKYREHCKKTGQPYNYSHKVENFSLNYVKNILLNNFSNIEFIHENPLVDEYSFELVLKKTDGSQRKYAGNKNRSANLIEGNINSEKEFASVQTHGFTPDGTYKKFLMEIAKEGLKGKIKKFILKFIGFFAYWQEQINVQIFGEIADLRQKIAQIQKGTGENKGKNQLSARGNFPENTSDLIPPQEKIFVGDGDFKEIGEIFLNYFIDLVKLKPNERVLDVGCGIGRIAIPLTKYLDKDGLYEGFDIVAEGINWCRKNISTKYPNFNFQLADVFNKSYNPQGKYKASNYRFPYEDGYFNFIFLTSVFTHMLPQDMENYLREVSRVLKKNGRCFITFFLLNKEARTLISNGKSTLDFRYLYKNSIGDCLTINKELPEAAIAFDEKYILNLYTDTNLDIEKQIYYGSWCGKKQFLTFQDVIIAYKR